jgi:hypothetical protein
MKEENEEEEHDDNYFRFSKYGDTSKMLERMLEDYKKCCTQITKMATKNWIAQWNCCNKRQRMMYLTRDLRSY